MRRVAYNLCQDAFEKFVGMVDNAEAVTGRVIAHAKRLIANMKFIAHLFLQQILSLKMVTSVMEALLEGAPPSYKISFLLALLFECGHALEGDLQKSGRAGALKMDDIMSKLWSLQDGEPLLEKRTRSDIAKLLVLRKKGWKQKIAKRGDAGDVVYVEEVVGARPEY